MGDGGKPEKPYAALFLGMLSVAMLGAGLVGYFGDQEEAATWAFLVVGLFLALGAAFFSRIEGTVEFTKDGFKLPIGRALRAEKQIEDGRVISEDQLDEARKSLEEVLSRYSLPQLGTPRITHSPQPPLEPGQRPAVRPTPLAAEQSRVPPVRVEDSISEMNLGGTSRLGRDVLIVDDAVISMAALSSHDQAQVRSEVARMSVPDFDPEKDPRAIRRGDKGKSYRVHKVPDSDIRLWYRQKSDDDPHTLYVVVLEKKGDG